MIDEKETVKNSTNSLCDRMKAYENKVRTFLIPKVPVIIRLDGKAFHTYTRNFSKPFDPILIGDMQHTTKKLCEEIQNVKLGYSQSDEITLLLTDHENQEKEQWFKGNIQKISSISSSIATFHFNDYMEKNYWNLDENKMKKQAAIFDARCFNLPFIEVNNCYLWRQQDAIRNSIQSLGQANFSHKQLHKKSTKDIISMLEKKGIVWEDLPVFKQRGFTVVKEFYTIEGFNPTNKKEAESATRSRWIIDTECPIFSKSKDYIESIFPNYFI